MPKRAKELSALEVKRLEYPLDDMLGKGNRLLPVFVAVGGVPGLQLQLTQGGGKSWIYRYSVKVGDKTKRRSLGLGSYPTYGVAEARDKAREAVRLLDEGEDPIKARKAMRDKLADEVAKPTFAQAVNGWAKDNPHEFTSEKYRQAWLNSITTIEGLQGWHVDQLDDRQIWSALKDTVARSPDLASRVQGRIAAVLRWAAGERYITGPNPADTDWLKGKLTKELKGVQKGRRPALQMADAPRWWAALHEREGMGSLALQFLALTAARSGDVRGMSWGEVDLGKAVWTIPADRLKVKNKGDHSVPLADSALTLLNALPRMAGNDLVFPATRGGPLSDMTISKAMKDMHARDIKAGGAGFVDKDSERPAVPHGLRATFRTWAGEQGFSREHAELALAHVFGDDTERAYQRSSYTEQRRPMMEAWSGFLAGNATGGNVVEIRRG